MPKNSQQVPRRFGRRGIQILTARAPPTSPQVHPQFMNMQVVTTFSSDSTIPSVMLFTQTHAYIFNCGEGMQRLLQSKGRIPKYSDLFLTRINWDVAGGLPGYLLTTADLIGSKMKIHGPNNLAHFVATFRNYIFRTTMDLTTNEFSENPEVYIDERVTVTPIPLTLDPPSPKPTPTTEFSFANQFKFNSPLFEGTPEEALQMKEKIVHEMFKSGIIDENMDDAAIMAHINDVRKHRAATLSSDLAPTQPSLISMAYLIKNRDLPGKFDVEKAKALNIPVGKLFTELKNGNNVQIEVVENGEKVQKTILPEQVLGDPISGRAVLILDIPSQEYMKKALKNEALNSELVKTADVVVHMLSDDIATNIDYVRWMDSFSESTKHLVMAPGLMPDNLAAPESYLLNLERNLLDKSIFPLCNHAGELTFTSNSFSKKYTPALPLPSPYPNPRCIVDIRRGSEIDFRGKVKYSAGPRDGDVVEFRHYLGPNSAYSRMAIEAKIKQTAEKISAMERGTGVAWPGDDVEIHTLGTGSAVPNKYRNVSCTVLKIPGVGNIILDCGEGSLAYLKRHLPPSEYLEFFRNLRTIFVSHLHADHHLGIIGLIREYATIQNALPLDKRQPLFIVGPWRIFNSLYEYNEVENIHIDEYVIPFHSYDLRPARLLPPSSKVQNLDQELFQGFLSELNLHSFETCYVPHCPQSYGVAITHKSGWKIVYSGDCRPSGDLVEIGRGATVVIHEATVADTQPQDALDKMHCTTAEAIMIGKRMNARYILLTHFSQKWSRVPEFVIDWDRHKHEHEKYGNVGIAFDHMTVKLGEMWKLPLMYDAFEVMYKDEKERKYYIRLKGEKEDGNGTEGDSSKDTEEPASKRRKMDREITGMTMEAGQ